MEMYILMFESIKWILFTIFPFLERKYDVYLAGKMSGIADNNFAAFNNYTNKLREAGYTVFSPPEQQKSWMTYEQCMTMDIDAILNKCRSVVLLPGEGWRDSVGASVEVTVAHVCGRPVYHIQDTEKGGITLDKVVTKSIKPYQNPK